MIAATPRIVDTTEPGAWTPWASEVGAVREGLVTTGEGLSDAEAISRRAEFGPNRLPAKIAKSGWRLLFSQFRGFLNVTLMVAAVIAGFVGDVKDAVLIAGVVVFNAILGFVQEHRAEQALAALEKLVPHWARVRREGVVRSIAADELVPGDVVVIEAGERVPADGRLVVSHSLEIDESALTGESVAAVKDAADLLDIGATVGDRTNCSFMNTIVTRGRGELLVTATGSATEMGRVAGMLVRTEPPATPLQVQLDQLGKRLAVIALFLVAGISALEVMRGESWLEVALEAVALAVAAIPEGLPVVVTVTLALGMQRMARNRAVMKRLGAVETLGCTTVICSDKTGTLTLNQMTARECVLFGRAYSVTGEGYHPDGQVILDGRPAPSSELAHVLTAVTLCNDSRVADGSVVGDPTEGALLVLATKGGLDVEAVRTQWPRLAELPFESHRKLMATFHSNEAAVRVMVKGAPDVILGRASKIVDAAGARALGNADRANLLAENERLAARGLRVLAIAWRTISRAELDASSDLSELVVDLELAGLVGLMDPPRSEARDAIELCRRAGVAVKMITGDHRGTAQAIAAELGLHGDAVTGPELDALDDAALRERVDGIAVFARVTPEHKLRIVRVLQARGHVVAMTGDGVNDAPALKSADIGVAMGSGTEVAKEAATMVLTDDNFASIVGAVREGRTIYDNIVKFVRFQLSTNMGALGAVFVAPLLGMPSPLSAAQILWVAMIMDGPPALSLGLDPARANIMEERPRDPRSKILNWSRLGALAWSGAIMATGTLAVLWYGTTNGMPARASTLSFTTFVLFQFFNVLCARSEAHSIFNRQLFANVRLWIALVVVGALQVLVVHVPLLQGLFGTHALTAGDWVLATAVASTIAILEEIRKFAAGRVRLRRRGARSELPQVEPRSPSVRAARRAR